MIKRKDPKATNTARQSIMKYSLEKSLVRIFEAGYIRSHIKNFWYKFAPKGKFWGFTEKVE